MFPVEFQQSPRMDATKTQAEKLAIAQKTIYEQMIKIMELEEEDKKAEFDKIKSQNQILIKSMACQNDLIERLKSENEDLKLQKQSLDQELSNVQKSNQVFDSENLELKMEELKIKHESQINQLEDRLNKANTRIEDLKLNNQSLQDDWFNQESKIRNLNDIILDLENKLQIANSQKQNLTLNENQQDLPLDLSTGEKVKFEQEIEIQNLTIKQKFEINSLKETNSNLEAKVLERDQTINNLNDQIQILVDALENANQNKLLLKDEINKIKVDNHNDEETLPTFKGVNSKQENANQDLVKNQPSDDQNSKDLEIDYQIALAMNESLTGQDKIKDLHKACQEGLKEQVIMLLQTGIYLFSYTVWKVQDFCITNILREINFEDSRSATFLLF